MVHYFSSQRPFLFLVLVLTIICRLQSTVTSDIYEIEQFCCYEFFK